MTTFKITYNGNSSRFRNLNYEINANSAREAVEKYYAQFLSSDYFPQDDGSIFDQNGDKVADAGDDYIEYDGGYFEAEQQQDVRTLEINDKVFSIYVTPASENQKRMVTIQNALNPVEFNEYEVSFFGCDESDSDFYVESAALNWLRNIEVESEKMKQSEK